MTGLGLLAILGWLLVPGAGTAPAAIERAGDLQVQVEPDRPDGGPRALLESGGPANHPVNPQGDEGVATPETLGRSGPQRPAMSRKKLVDARAVVMPGGSGLSGRVVFDGAKEEPLREVRIYAFDFEGSRPRLGLKQRTSAEGRFSFGGIRGEVRLELGGLPGELKMISGEIGMANAEQHTLTVAGVLLDVQCVDGTQDEDAMWRPTRLAMTQVAGRLLNPEKRATRHFLWQESDLEPGFVPLALNSTYHFFALDGEGRSYEGQYRTTGESGYQALVLVRGEALFGDVLIRATRSGMPSVAKLKVVDFRQQGELRLFAKKTAGHKNAQCWTLLRGVPAGETRLSVVLVGAEGWAVPAEAQLFTVVPGSALTLDLEVFDGGTMTVSAAELEPGPEKRSAFARVRLRGSEEWVPFRAYSLTDNRLGYHPLPYLRSSWLEADSRPVESLPMTPGLYDLALDPRVGESVVVEVEVVAGADTPVAVRLPEPTNDE